MLRLFAYPAAFPAVRVDKDRDGPVVHQPDLHASAEHPCLHRESLLTQSDADLLIQTIGIRSSRRPGKAGPVSMRDVTVEGKLADHQERTMDIMYGTIHESCAVGEDTESCEFMYHERHIRRIIIGGNAQEHQQPRTNGSDLLPIHRDRCLTDSLNNRTHICSL